MSKPSLSITVGLGALVLCLCLYGGWFYCGSPHSDPPSDFKRFVMGGPHWADEDKEAGYRLEAVTLPKSVRVLRSEVFHTPLAGEGAALYFAIDGKDLDWILATDDFEPTDDPEEKARLNQWSRRYLWVSSDDLGTAPSFYITKISYNNVIRTLMAVNRERSHAIFLHINFN